MLRRRKSRIAAVSAGAIAIFGVVVPVAVSASADTWVKGANRAWSASSRDTNFVSSSITVTCKTDTMGGSTVGPGPDIGFLAMNAPQFSNCDDNLGPHDTVTTKKTGWKVAFYWEKANAHCPAGTGDGKTLHCVVITVPKDAATIFERGFACTMTLQPNGATQLGATAKAPGGTTKDTFAISKAPLAYSGCGTSGTFKFSGIYTLQSPNGGVLVNKS